MDLLTDVLSTLQLRSSLHCRAELSAPWAVGVPAVSTVVFHYVERGQCWLRLEGDGPPVALADGDLALVSHGAAHRLANQLSTPLQSWLELGEVSPERYAALRFGGGGANTTVLCGTFGFEQGLAHPLIALLPPLIVLGRHQGSEHERLYATLRLLAVEASVRGPGAHTIVRRLTDVLVIQIISAWIEGQAPRERGWLGAVRDPQVGAVLRAIHSEPERDWTVAGLAAVAGVSRSVFAERFTAMVGEPPLRYLTRWRMQLAVGMLRARDSTVAAIADQLGYESEGAFSRAFKRLIGAPPAAFRRGLRERQRLAGAALSVGNPYAEVQP